MSFTINLDLPNDGSIRLCTVLVMYSGIQMKVYKGVCCVQSRTVALSAVPTCIDLPGLEVVQCAVREL